MGHQEFNQHYHEEYLRGQESTRRWFSDMRDSSHEFRSKITTEEEVEKFTANSFINKLKAMNGKKIPTSGETQASINLQNAGHFLLATRLVLFEKSEEEIKELGKELHVKDCVTQELPSVGISHEERKRRNFIQVSTATVKIIGAQDYGIVWSAEIHRLNNEIGSTIKVN